MTQYPKFTTHQFLIKELYDKVKRKSSTQLLLTREFESYFTWGESAQIRFIETLLLGIPIPSVYFYQNEDGTHQIIDGIQRINAIIQFMDDALELKRKHLDYLRDPISEFVGAVFSSLPLPPRRRFENTTITVHIFKPQTSTAIRYTIFNRLNQYPSN